jgi:hypothetical protein
MGGDGDHDARVSLVLHGQVVCTEEDEQFVKQWLRQAVHEADPHMRIDTFFVADPRVRRHVAARSLFHRVTLRPAHLTRATSQKPLCCALPHVVVRASVWLAMFGILLRAGCVQPEFRDRTRRLFSIIGVSCFGASAIAFLPALIPAAFMNHVVKTFDFWYVLLHVAALGYIESTGLETIHDKAENIALHVALSFSFFFGYLLAEAFRISSAAKAGRYLLLAIHCAVQVLTWTIAHARRAEKLDLGIFHSTLGAVAQTLYVGLAAYMIRAAVTTLSGSRCPPYLPLSCAGVVQ